MPKKSIYYIEVMVILDIVGGYFIRQDNNDGDLQA